jgi:hypothetical protein
VNIIKDHAIFIYTYENNIMNYFKGVENNRGGEFDQSTLYACNSTMNPLCTINVH